MEYILADFTNAITRLLKFAMELMTTKEFSLYLVYGLLAFFIINGVFALIIQTIKVFFMILSTIIKFVIICVILAILYGAYLLFNSFF